MNAYLFKANVRHFYTYLTNYITLQCKVKTIAISQITILRELSEVKTL